MHIYFGIILLTLANKDVKISLFSLYFRACTHTIYSFSSMEVKFIDTGQFSNFFLIKLELYSGIVLLATPLLATLLY